MTGTKRSRSPSPSSSLSRYYSSKRTNTVQAGRVDPVYGQRSALPANDDDSLSLDEEGMDALNYLRSVRAEAEDLPPIFYAPNETRSANANDKYDRSIYESGVGDFRGYYEDGAYFAAPEGQGGARLGMKDEETQGQDPQLAYFDSILARFEILRQKMQRSPPSDTVKALGPDHPVYLKKMELRLCRWWRWKMKMVDPLPAQVASMDKKTVLNLLRLLTGGALLQSRSDISIRISRWAWALLARLPVKGELGSDEVGVVRELGKKAVLLGVRLKAGGRLGDGLDEVEEVFDDDNEVDIVDSEMATSLRDEDLVHTDDLQEVEHQAKTKDYTQASNSSEAAKPAFMTEHSSASGEDVWGATENPHVLEEIKTRLLASITSDPSITAASEIEDPTTSETEIPGHAPAHQTVDWNTQATIDMIITIAGEMYGQRDLLEFREVWGE